MNLEDFVKDVLTSIDRAIDGARVEMNREVSLVSNQNQRTVEFDIAVSVEASNLINGKAGIRVLEFVDGAAEASKNNRNSTVTRILFGVNISSATKSEDEAREARLRALQRK